MKIHVVINPAAGVDEPVLAALNRVFAKAGVAWDVTVTHAAGDGLRAAQAAVADGIDRVLAYGGDGTISEVAHGLSNTEIPLGVLPGGTGNVIAQELGIPADLSAAAALAVSSHAVLRRIDAMECRDRLFLQRIGIGAEARAILGASREDKDASGWLAYARRGFAEFGAVGPDRFDIVADGVELSIDAVTCIIANCGRLGRGGLNLAPDIDPADGKLDLLILERTDLVGVGAVGLASLGWNGGPRSLADGVGAGPLHHFSVRNVEVRCLAQPPVHGDGDSLDAGNLSIAVAPGCVTIATPANSA